LDEKLTREEFQDKLSEFYDMDKIEYLYRNLKDNLVENADYATISEELFEYLQETYECDYVIARYAIEDIETFIRK
jgi:hypothetical protein